MIICALVQSWKQGRRICLAGRHSIEVLIPSEQNLQSCTWVFISGSFSQYACQILDSEQSVAEGTDSIPICEENSHSLGKPCANPDKTPSPSDQRKQAIIENNSSQSEGCTSRDSRASASEFERDWRLLPQMRSSSVVEETHWWRDFVCSCCLQVEPRRLVYKPIKTYKTSPPRECSHQCSYDTKFRMQTSRWAQGTRNWHSSCRRPTSEIVEALILESRWEGVNPPKNRDVVSLRIWGEKYSLGRRNLRYSAEIEQLELIEQFEFYCSSPRVRVSQGKSAYSISLWEDTQHIQELLTAVVNQRV